MEETVTAKALEWEECVRCGRSSYETGVGSGERMRGIERKEKKEEAEERTERL